jgi:hypothetical protein
MVERVARRDLRPLEAGVVHLLTIAAVVALFLRALQPGGLFRQFADWFGRYMTDAMLRNRSSASPS